MTTQLAVLITTLFLVFGCSGTNEQGNSSSGNDSTDDTSTGNGSSDGTTNSSGSGDGDGTTNGTIDGGTGETLYKGSFTATVNMDGQSEEYAGKIELKLRADGLFSGAGSGAATNNNGNSISLELHGTLTEDGTLDGEVVWKWMDETQSQDVVCPLTGALADEGFQGDFTGGTQQQNLQGSFTLLP